MPHLKVSNLAAVRGGRRVFASVSFAVGPGETLILKGRNGAGKSTLLRILAGLGEAASGNVVFDGAQAGGAIGEHCHYSAHADALKGALTAEENLAFWATYCGGGDPHAALDAFGIGHLADIPAGLLSAGQKRRLGLARLLLAPRSMWLLDEPTVSLDAKSQNDLAAIMTRHVASGGLLVAATHAPLGIEGARELDLGAFAQGPA